MAGCARDVAVEPPTPGSSATAACPALVAALPRQLDGHDRRTTTPASPFTAAWGSPAITLRCGVPRPPQLAPTSELVTVNGVDWLPIPLTNGYRFVSVGRVANVEVDVPKDYAPEINAIVDLADPVTDALPVAAATAGPGASPAPS